jgi:sulfate transport system permease protein
MVSVAEKFSGATASVPTSLTEPRPVRRILIGLALAFLGVSLVVPLVAVFVKAMEKGLAVYWSAISGPAALAAIRLTAMTAI